MARAQLRLRPPAQLGGMVGDHVGDQRRRPPGILHPLQQVADGLLDRLVLCVCPGSRQS